jgi:hypothetical protein
MPGREPWKDMFSAAVGFLQNSQGARFLEKRVKLQSSM